MENDDEGKEHAEEREEALGFGNEEDENDEDCEEDEERFFANEVAYIRLAVVGGEDDDFVASDEGAGVEDHCFVVGDGKDAAGLVFDFDVLDPIAFIFDGDYFGFKSFLFSFARANGVLDRRGEGEVGADEKEYCKGEEFFEHGFDCLGFFI